MFQNKVWEAGTYTLANHIGIQAGASFEIQPGAVVETAAGSYDYKSISDFAGGQFNLNAVEMKTDLILSQPGSVVNEVLFSAGSSLYYERSDLFQASNLFTDSAQLVVGQGDQKAVPHALSARMPGVLARIIDERNQPPTQAPAGIEIQRHVAVLGS